MSLLERLIVTLLLPMTMVLFVTKIVVEVTFDWVNCDVKCKCRLFMFRGILCRHSLAILVWVISGRVQVQNTNPSETEEKNIWPIYV